MPLPPLQPATTNFFSVSVILLLFFSSSSLYFFKISYISDLSLSDLFHLAYAGYFVTQSFKS